MCPHNAVSQLGGGRLRVVPYGSGFMGAISEIEKSERPLRHKTHTQVRGSASDELLPTVVMMDTDCINQNECGDVLSRCH